MSTNYKQAQPLKISRQRPSFGNNAVQIYAKVYIYNMTIYIYIMSQISFFPVIQRFKAQFCFLETKNGSALVNQYQDLQFPFPSKLKIEKQNSVGIKQQGTQFLKMTPKKDIWNTSNNFCLKGRTGKIHIAEDSGLIKETY